MDKGLILKGIPPFNSLRSIELKQIAERASLVHYARGDIVYREGEPGDALYVVVSGRLKAYVDGKDEGEKVFTYFHNGDYFGEVSLLTEKAHSANVRAISDSVILK
ncbi:MAG: cyclic nucleotide-binding domain-containing protein [Candidatus Omnitrophica bacterium]|nr:cyclic nucleotide-binding domain-containing protein [Candidatus Omnitrophota bacterium]